VFNLLALVLLRWVVVQTGTGPRRESG